MSAEPESACWLSGSAMRAHLVGASSKVFSRVPLRSHTRTVAELELLAIGCAPTMPVCPAQVHTLCATLHTLAEPLTWPSGVTATESPSVCPSADGRRWYSCLALPPPTRSARRRAAPRREHPLATRLAHFEVMKMLERPSSVTASRAVGETLTSALRPAACSALIQRRAPDAACSDRATPPSCVDRYGGRRAPQPRNHSTAAKSMLENRPSIALRMALTLKLRRARGRSSCGDDAQTSAGRSMSNFGIPAARRSFSRLVRARTRSSRTARLFAVSDRKTA